MTHPIYGMLLKMVYYKLVMKYVESSKAERIMMRRGGGIREAQLQAQWNIRKCVN